VSGKIDVSVAGEHVATLSAEEAALLANVLRDLGTSTKRRGAITIAAALKSCGAPVGPEYKRRCEESRDGRRA
jgi:hypothetical protein